MNPALRPFQHRNFRVFYIGNGVSLVGTWLQTVAVSWLVYRLTGSALLLGLATGAQQLPMLFLSPIAGVWSDRLDRRKVLIATQTLSMIPAFLLAWLTWTEHVNVWHVIVIATCLGIVNALGNPTRQAFVHDILDDKRDLPNAIALNATMFNATRFIGPPIAGFLIAAFGEALCFFLNAISFAAVVIAYLTIRVAPRARTASAHWVADLRDGARYAFGFVATARTLALVAVLSMCTAPYQALMPLRAGDSQTLGVLLGAVGLGAIAGTGFLATRRGVEGIGRLITITSLTAGTSLIVFSFVHVLALQLAILVVFGFASFATFVGCNTVLQTVSEPDKRGRVISFYVMCMAGMAPIGHFAAGALAEAVGGDAAFRLLGAAATIAAVVFVAGLAKWQRAVVDAHARTGMIRRS